MGAQDRHAADKAADGTPARVIRRRPRDRRAQIAAASAEAFGALGYHGVSMDDIASRLDISSAALYRHYPSKYALFREEVLRLGTVSQEAARLPDATGLPPAQRLERVLDALIDAAIANRRSAALLRWQRRYLEDADAATLADQLAGVNAALTSLLAETRPALPKADRSVLAAAELSVLSSIGDHHVSIPVRALTARLTAACRALAACELPPAGNAEAESFAATEIPLTFKHELLLMRAVELFHQRGYPNVSVEDIATAAGLPASSAVYRFYRGKGDILTAAFRRAADRVSAAIGPAVAAAETPEQALDTLIELYVAGSFAERELTFVYYAEISNVPPEERTVLRNIQRLNVEEWAKLLVGVRPELSAAEARLLVHAAFALVVDLGERFGSTDPACSPRRVIRLMQAILFDRPAVPTA